MQIEIVVAGSKRAQESRDVPSFVSVVSAADIKEHGYRTLADVLRTLPGLYVSSDRNYSYVGVRGFGRPGDYNSRILLLLNGLRTNESVYDLAYIGEEFSVDVDMIERVEVIRGPSSSLYGSNAVFAVINVVTRAGSSLAGTEVATTAASFGTYSGRASYGHTFTNGLDLLASGTYSDSKGRNLYSQASRNGVEGRLLAPGKQRLARKGASDWRLRHDFRRQENPHDRWIEPRQSDFRPRVHEQRFVLYSSPRGTVRV